MRRKEFEKKYGKKIIDKIFNEGYLDGCTIAIIDGEWDVPESDITNAMHEIKGEPVVCWD
jgi:hypothetical protein